MRIAAREIGIVESQQRGLDQDLLLERFDASNLHWGSDFSPALEFVSFEETIEVPRLASLPERDRALILGDGLAIKLQRAGSGKSR